MLDHLARRSKGTPQSGDGSYFSLQDGVRIRTIENPAQLTREEILHRLRSFEILTIRLEDRLHEVTAIEEGSSFTTSDGSSLSPRRCLFLPVWLYRIYRRVRPKPTSDW